MMEHDIFISYSNKQKSIADGVCHYLEENGFKCWMSPRDIPVGSEYGDLIEEAIKTSRVVVLVFSQAASISKWVKGEINVAFTEDKPILPFRVDETEIKGGFRVMLNQKHWIDAFPQYAERLPDLLNSVCGFLGRQPQKVSNERNLEQQTRQQVQMSSNPSASNASQSGSVNCREFVDLGLPSGTLWATCNEGASKPEDYGNYLSWDEGKTAVANWGKGWGMPSKEQWEELMKNTKSTWTTKNGLKGRLFTAKNGNSLFLPAAGDHWDGELYDVVGYGYYWSSSLKTDSPLGMWYFFFGSGNCGLNGRNPCYGQSVRAVRSAK